MPDKPTVLQTLQAALSAKTTLQTSLDEALAEVTRLTDLNATQATAADELQRCNSDLTAQIGVLTGERDNALAEVTRLRNEAKSAEDRAAELVAGMNFPVNDLPKQTKEIAKSEKEYVAAIDAENDPVKKHQLYTEYAAEFLDK